MSEGTSQPADQPQRPRAAQGTGHISSKQTKQTTAVSPSAPEPAAPLAVPDTTGSAAPQTLPAAEAQARPAPDEPPIGVRWGEFPPPERQVDLKRMQEAWEREPIHGNRLGPFAQVKLNGADVYWMAVLEAGAGDVALGQQKLIVPFSALSSLHLEGARLRGAQLQGAMLHEARLQRANLIGAQLQGAILRRAQLRGAILQKAQLQGATLYRAQLEEADLSDAQLGGVNMREALLDVKTKLAGAHFDDTVLLADVTWNDVPMIRVPWRKVSRFGEEAEAHQSHNSDGKIKDKRQRLAEYEAAGRAYRQLAITLRDQGITDVADHFSYRALIMQRKALWWQMRSTPLLAQPAEQDAIKEQEEAAQQVAVRALRTHSHLTQQILFGLKGVVTIGRLFGSYFFSWFLAVLTGYGHRMSRIVLTYVLLILAFAGAYWSLDLHRQPQPFSYWQAIILSVTAFHGRVFFNPFNLSDPQIVVTALEAIVGLVIEGVFIAMLTQRFFNR